MITEKTEEIALIQRACPKSVSDFLEKPKPIANANMFSRVATFHDMIKDLIRHEGLQSSGRSINNSNGYSEQYLFFTDDSESYAVKINLFSCEQWQSYTRAIFKPASMLGYNKLVEQCKVSISEKYKPVVLKLLSDMMVLSRQDYNFYCDDDNGDLFFTVENNKKFTRMHLEVIAAKLD
jgi:hypothetical protein